MIANYLRIAIRNLRRHKVYSIINIMGLAIGMTSCLMIGIYVADEFSYDRYHTNGERIYRVVPDLQMPDGVRQLAQSSPPVAATMKEEYAEVVNMARFMRSGGIYRVGENRFQEDRVIYADPEFFNIFSHRFIAGTPEKALHNQQNVVITESIARKFFGNASPLDKLLIRGDETYIVSAVVEDVPQNSHFLFDMVFSLESFASNNSGVMENWGAFYFPSYVMLAPGTDPRSVAVKLPAMLEKHLGVGNGIVLQLQPLKDIYLYSHRRGEHGARGNPGGLYVFMGIAAIILLLACVNFMNLTTARAVDRAREVGIRKVIGANRRQLARQFLGEAMLFAVLAFVISVWLVYLILPMFNHFSGKNLPMNLSFAGLNVLWLPLIAAIIGLIAGSYPAISLSKYKPVSVLKGAYKSTRAGIKIRKGLVVFQFSISIVLMVATLVVFDQLEYFQNHNLGLNQEKMLIVDFRRDAAVRQHYQTISGQLSNHPAVAKTSASSSTPGSGLRSSAVFVITDGDTLGGILGEYAIDEKFLETYGITLLSGRNFSPESEPIMASQVLINQAAASHFGWSSPGDAIGKSLFGVADLPAEVIGVVQNFNYSSLHREIEPLYLTMSPDRFRYFSLRLNGENLFGVVDQLKEIWQTHVPNRPFDYQFLDEQLDRQYLAEARFSRVVGTFSMIAIFIASLGILGLSAFEVEQRTREVGIRKVLGATVSQIVVLLSKDYLRLVVIANLFAWPIAYWVTQSWLQDFAYRVNIEFLSFFVSGGAACLIAFLVISYHAISTALANPVESLRDL